MNDVNLYNIKKIIEKNIEKILSEPIRKCIFTFPPLLLYDFV